MADRKLDFTRFYPEVYQAVSGNDYIVYAYMNDGAMRALDMKPLIESGGVNRKRHVDSLILTIETKQLPQTNHLITLWQLLFLLTLLSFHTPLS